MLNSVFLVFVSSTSVPGAHGTRRARAWEVAAAIVRGEKPIQCVAFSPDGSLIAAGDAHFDFGPGDVRISTHQRVILSDHP